MKEKKEFDEELEGMKRASVSQILFQSARLLNEHALERVRRRTGHTKLRSAHTALFPHIDLEGTRLTELAKHLGISKQAVSQLVLELKEYGVLEQIPDPQDGRAKLIRFSKKGRAGLLSGLTTLGELEEEIALRIGSERLERLHKDLTFLLADLKNSKSWINE